MPAPRRAVARAGAAGHQGNRPDHRGDPGARHDRAARGTECQSGAPSRRPRLRHGERPRGTRGHRRAASRKPCRPDFVSGGHGPVNLEEETMVRHELNSTPKTVHWGYWDATLPPILTIRSGDEVVVHTLSAQPPPDTHLPEDRRRAPRELLEIMESVTPMLGPHILTGPVFIESAEPGNVLQVDVLDVRLRQDWGRNMIMPLKGTLPDDFPDPWRVILDLD